MRHLTLDHHGENGLTQLQSRHQGSEDVSLIGHEGMLSQHPAGLPGQRVTAEIHCDGLSLVPISIAMPTSYEA